MKEKGVLAVSTPVAIWCTIDHESYLWFSTVSIDPDAACYPYSLFLHFQGLIGLGSPGIPTAWSIYSVQELVKAILAGNTSLKPKKKIVERIPEPPSRQKKH